MAKVTPAHIRYTPTNPDGSEGQEQVIDFHTVISEDHQASAQVTKYPVQTGFHISTNSIRNNRIVSIQGAISNTAMDFIPTTTQKTVARDYGEDSQRVVFQALEALVNSGTKVKVVTNLGVYEPVVFTKFQTKQKEGMVDSMHFTITGEEIIEYDEENYSAPIPLTFSTKSGVEREKIVRELEEYSMFVGSCDEPSQANERNGEDFVITGKDKGKTGKVLQVIAGTERVIVEGINLIKKHTKPVPQLQQPGGIVEKEAPLQVSNVAILNSKTGKADRVGFRIEDGKKVRFFKSNNELI